MGKLNLSQTSKMNKKMGNGNQGEPMYPASSEVKNKNMGYLGKPDYNKGYASKGSHKLKSGK